MWGTLKERINTKCIYVQFSPQTNLTSIIYFFIGGGGRGEQQPWRTNSSDHGRQIEREPKLFCSASRDFVSRGSREREPKLFLAETFVERIVTTNAAWKRNDVETRSLEDKSPTTDGWRIILSGTTVQEPVHPSPQHGPGKSIVWN